MIKRNTIFPILSIFLLFIELFLIFISFTIGGGFIISSIFKIRLWISVLIWILTQIIIGIIIVKANTGEI